MARTWLTPEEAELADVERQMEEQLVAQHRLVDRVIAQRPEPDGSLRYLAKVAPAGPRVLGKPASGGGSRQQYKAQSSVGRPKSLWACSAHSMEI